MSWPGHRYAYTPHTHVTNPKNTSTPSKALKISDLLSPVNTQIPTRKPDTIVYPQPQSRHVYHVPAPTFRQPSAPDWEGFLGRLDQPDILPSSPGEHSTRSARPTSSARSPASTISRPVYSRSPSAASDRPVSPYIPPAPSNNINIPPLPDYDYKLLIRQQPVAARACGHGDRDRRVIDPPPILELKITNKQDGSPRSDNAAIFAMYCSLVDADTDRQTGCNIQGDLDARMMSAMMGASTQSPFKGKDEHGNAGTFFVFSDLSCRLTGRFRLHFTLLRVDATNMQAGARHPMVATMSSDVFTAYNAKEFPGMQASTQLLRALRRQGLTVSIKKGSELRKLKARTRSGSSPAASESEISTIAYGKRKFSREPSLQAGPGGIDEHKRLRQDVRITG